MVIDVRPEHSRKADAPMLVTSPEKVMVPVPLLKVWLEIETLKALVWRPDDDELVVSVNLLDAVYVMTLLAHRVNEKMTKNKQVIILFIYSIIYRYTKCPLSQRKETY